jgi:hypothetical protein
VGHGHDDGDGVAADAEVIDEAEVDDGEVAAVELLVEAVAEGVPEGAFGDGGVAGFAGAGEASWGSGGGGEGGVVERGGEVGVEKAVAELFEAAWAVGRVEGDGGVGVFLVKNGGRT